ncbi:MAG: LysM peptidoglycan-binding domain-containing protein [Proteobacteria bacterium]|nr:LysM peptidoglycan-binding domain-containing protein [Pseudomonadota bacterium]
MSLGWKIVKVIGLFFFCITLTYAKTGKHGLSESAPESYLVQEGDTLWDIACKFLNDPSEWQELWHANPEIQNPNLIFPGDTVELKLVDGKRKLQVRRGHSSQTLNKRTGVIKLHPRVRELPAEKAIPTIPLHIIGPFLNESRVVSQQQAEHCPRIIALDEDHIVVGTGDLFYVKGLSATNTEDLFVVFRPTKTYFDPKSKEKLGIEGHVLAKAQLDQAGEPARLVLRQSFEEVKIGDRITGTGKENISPYFVPKAPKGKPIGQIISVFGGLTQIGQYQVLVITGGKDRQREIGDVLGVYQTHKDLPLRLTANKDKRYHFPPLNIGTCVVFRVFDKVSYVLVMNAIRPIYLLDEVGRT